MGAHGARKMEGLRAGAITIGTAGWSLRREIQHAFDAEGTHLARYASRLRGVEINSSFYRSHRPATYRRWAESVPAWFRFSVKVPRTISHERMLVDDGTLLGPFLDEVRLLDERLGPLLLQLPPSARFERERAHRFLSLLRARHAGAVVVEPRHPSWFTDDVDAMLRDFAIGGVAADPAVVPMAGAPWGDQAVQYFRLHGSPEMYRSNYSADALHRMAARLAAAAAEGADAWCVFDNTAEGAATHNALDLEGRLSASSAISPRSSLPASSSVPASRRR